MDVEGFGEAFLRPAQTLTCFCERKYNFQRTLLEGLVDFGIGPLASGRILRGISLRCHLFVYGRFFRVWIGLRASSVNPCLSLTHLKTGRIGRCTGQDENK